MTEQDPLETLRDQIRAATEAAERLVREVASTAPAAAAETAAPPPAPAADGELPRAGWEPPRGSETAAELQSLASLLQSVRDLLPADLQAQLTEVIREVLLLLRAVIDWMVARIEREGRGQELEVEDIPIS